MTLAPLAIPTTPGLHHVSVLARDPLTNLAFWTGTMGQRLVKRTVNFDAPTMHHLYYGDGSGTPGTVLTFFPVPGTARSQEGTGTTSAVAYALSRSALDGWRDRLAAAGVQVKDLERWDRQLLAFDDPDGLHIELVGVDAPPDVAAWDGEPLPAEMRLCGLESVTLRLASAGASQALLERLGYSVVAERLEGTTRRLRLETGSGAAGQAIELLEEGRATPRRDGRGAVHHVAFRLSGEDEQARVAELMRALGRTVSAVHDRGYFRSIYLREPGGVLIEFATDGPGFTVDETPATLGGSLRLPPWLEPSRASIESALPSLELDREVVS